MSRPAKMFFALGAFNVFWAAFTNSTDNALLGVVLVALAVVIGGDQ